MIKNYNNELFTILENKMVWLTREERDAGDITITKECGDKILPVQIFINANVNRLGQSVFTLEDLITWTGSTPKRGAGKNIEKYKEVLKTLLAKGYIDDITSEEIDNLKQKDIIRVKYLFEVDDKFFGVNFNNVNRVLNVEYKVDKIELLKTYCYINARIEHRDTDMIDEATGLFIGGKAESWHDVIEKISKELYINKDTFTKYIEILKNLNLVFVDNIGLIKKDGKTTMSNNVYCVKGEELKYALKESIKYYKDEGYTILGKKTDTEIKKLNGLKGKKKELENKNKDTKEVDKKIAKIENEKIDRAIKRLQEQEDDDNEDWSYTTNPFQDAQANADIEARRSISQYIEMMQNDIKNEFYDRDLHYQWDRVKGEEEEKYNIKLDDFDCRFWDCGYYENLDLRKLNQIKDYWLKIKSKLNKPNVRVIKNNNYLGSVIANYTYDEELDF